MFSMALIATDLSEPSERFLQCKAGLRSLSIQDVILGFCLSLHQVRGVRANVEEILKPDLDRCREMLESNHQLFHGIVRAELGGRGIEDKV